MALYKYANYIDNVAHAMPFQNPQLKLSNMTTPQIAALSTTKQQNKGRINTAIKSKRPNGVNFHTISAKSPIMVYS